MQLDYASIEVPVIEHRKHAFDELNDVIERDVHKEDARNLIEAAKEAQIFERTIWLFGGPRVDHKTALELGFDAGFGPGTKPSDVANYIYYRLLERQNRAPPPEPTAHGTPDATISLEEPALPATGGARRAQHRETKE